MEFKAPDRLLALGMAVVFIGLTLFFTVVSAILNYHWVRYEVSNARIMKMRLVYYGVSISLFLVMTLFIVALLLQ